MERQIPWNTEKYKWKCFSIIKILSTHIIFVGAIQHGKGVGQKRKDNGKCNLKYNKNITIIYEWFVRRFILVLRMILGVNWKDIQCTRKNGFINILNKFAVHTNVFANNLYGFVLLVIFFFFGKQFAWFSSICKMFLANNLLNN